MELTSIETNILREQVIERLKTVYDPEIPVNIFDMGLIYGIDIGPEAFVNVTMTLTSPGCPVAGTLPPEVEEKVSTVPGVSGAKVEVVWEPTYSIDMMSEEAKLELGFL